MLAQIHPPLWTRVSQSKMFTTGNISHTENNIYLTKYVVNQISNMFLFLTPQFPSFLLHFWRAVRTYQPNLEVRDSIWGVDWLHSLHLRAPSWGFPRSRISFDRLVILPNALRPFKIYCAPPYLGITRTSTCRLNFAQRPIFSGIRFFNEPEISDSGPPA